MEVNVWNIIPLKTIIITCNCLPGKQRLRVSIADTIFLWVVRQWIRFSHLLVSYQKERYYNYHQLPWIALSQFASENSLSILFFSVLNNHKTHNTRKLVCMQMSSISFKQREEMLTPKGYRRCLHTEYWKVTNLVRNAISF